ncbi:MAG: DUF2892 domain-containing protein [Methylococcales bacterium]|nr:DUF2892 domain-containing protein [Methylococcales bacterium]
MNVGGVDRTIRIILGLIIISWGIYAKNWLGAAGIILLLTGFIRWCPAYLPFGFKTCK